MRGLFERAAGARLGSPVETVEDGTFTTATGSVTYWDLAGEVDLDVGFEAVDEAAGRPTELIGSDLARIDLADKVLGRPRYLQDLRLPGQVFGRVLRPPYRGARARRARCRCSASAPRRHQHRGRRQLRGRSRRHGDSCPRGSCCAAVVGRLGRGSLPLDTEQVGDFVRTSPSVDTDVVDPSGEPTESAAFTLRARYSRPFLAHASIGTSTAIALLDDGHLQVWSHTQGVYPLRRRHRPSAGDAAGVRRRSSRRGRRLLRPQPGRRRRLRRGTAGAGRARPAGARAPGAGRTSSAGRRSGQRWSSRSTAGVPRTERITSWRWDGYGNGHSSRPGTLPTPSLLAFSHQADGSAIRRLGGSTA